MAPDPKEIQAWQELSKVIQGYTKDIQEAKKQADLEKATDRGQEANKEAQIADQLAKKQEKLFLEVAKAHAKLQEELDKQADANSKKEDLRLKEQLKQESATLQEEVRLNQQKLQAAIAEIDGEIKAREDATQIQAAGYKKLYDLGVMSGQTYLQKLKQLYTQEVADLQAILTRKEQLVILEAQNEAAKRGQILTVAQAKELKGYIDLENQKARLTDQFTARFTKDQDQVLKASNKVFSTKANWDSFFQKLQTEALTTGQKFQLLGNEIAASIGQSVSAAVSGADSFDAAMKKILKSALAALAGEAVVHVAKEIALAFSSIAAYDYPGASQHFAAAAKWTAVAALAGAAGAAMPSGSSSGGGSSSGNQPTIQQNASTKTTGNPTSSVNVAKLAGGGLIEHQMLAIVGDAPGGGNSPEAIIPLNDHAALAGIASAIAGHMKMAGGGEMRIHLESDIPMLVRKVSQKVGRGQARLLSSNSIRVTKRSV